MNLTQQQEAEIGFWRSELCRRGGAEEFMRAREQDLRDEAAYLPEVYDEKGTGLEVGCGLVSVLEFIRLCGAASEVTHIDATDPLMAEYKQIVGAMRRDPRAFSYLDSEPPIAGQYDFVWCINVIDHDPDPAALLAKIYDWLKPGGRLYFLVNFDPELYAPHYTLWDMRKVEDMMRPFHLQRGTLYYSDTWSKYVWSALYLKK